MHKIENQSKESKEFRILYEWLQITRKQNQSLRGDIKMMMDLIKIPVSGEQVNLLMKIIDPNEQKEKLLQEDFLKCFIIPEETKKLKQKQLANAFKYLSDTSETISFQKLFQLLKEQGLDDHAAQMVLKQMGEWETQNGQFDFKKFSAAHV